MNALRLSISPHIHSERTTRGIMLDVLIALLPAVFAGTLIFGVRSLAVIAVCLCAAVLSELIFCKIAKKEQTAGDLSAAVTGLLLALNLPASLPLWQAAVGAVFAIILVKCVFGGIGQNFANPAVTARVFMTLAFPAMANSAFPVLADAVAGATPLIYLGKGETLDIWALLLGLHGGAIGETCAIALILGGIYLILRGVISPHAPFAMLATVFFCTFAAKGELYLSLEYILSGGLLLGAFFMATDYATTPVTRSGKIIFGIGAGLLTFLIRFWGVYPEGASFAILLMNIITPYIDTLTAKKPFGGAKI